MNPKKLFLLIAATIIISILLANYFKPIDNAASLEVKIDILKAEKNTISVRFDFCETEYYQDIKTSGAIFEAVKNEKQITTILHLWHHETRVVLQYAAIVDVMGDLH